MKIHQIKLSDEFCDDVYNGIKRFEIRLNDRNYHVGDLIQFIPVGENKQPIKHKIQDKFYKIEYVLSGWGLQDGFVALSIKNITKTDYSEIVFLASMQIKNIDDNKLSPEIKQIIISGLDDMLLEVC